MTTEQINAGNKTIARFMGIETIVYNGKCIKVEGIKSIEMLYHSSWDWLKPVIDRIYTYSLAHSATVAPVTNLLIVVDIQPAWEACVAVIEELSLAVS